MYFDIDDEDSVEEVLDLYLEARKQVDSLYPRGDTQSKWLWDSFVKDRMFFRKWFDSHDLMFDLKRAGEYTKPLGGGI